MTRQLHHKKSIVVIVAHPDDETLWAGGTILSHADDWNCYVVSLCRGSDPDRAPRFHRVLEALGATGAIADLDDGPDQRPLPPEMIIREIQAMLPSLHFDLILTHNPNGEYTRHRRHEEVSSAVIQMWSQQILDTRQLYTFAYNDNKGRQLPAATQGADVLLPLSPPVWQQKYQLITEQYGFGNDSWEARTTPAIEAFWTFDTPGNAMRWLKNGGTKL